MLLASYLPDKSTSSIAYAIVFFQLPFGIFSASITTVLYPKMSKEAATGKIGELNKSLSFGYRNLWALLLPSAIVLILMGAPIISIAFQRKAFTLEDTIITAKVLTAYSLGMPFIGLYNITQRALYAAGEIRKPFYTALVTVIADISFSLFFVFVLHTGSSGLAYANSIAFFTGAVLQYIFLRKKTGFRLERSSLLTMLKVSAASVILTAQLYFSLKLAGNSWWQSGSSFKGLLILSFILIISAILILSMYYWMKIETVTIIFNRGKSDGNK
jgi:putative peptidoglycan lipid II flippase